MLGDRFTSAKENSKCAPHLSLWAPHPTVKWFPTQGKMGSLSQMSFRISRCKKDFFWRSTGTWYCAMYFRVWSRVLRQWDKQKYTRWAASPSLNIMPRNKAVNGWDRLRSSIRPNTCLTCSCRIIPVSAKAERMQRGLGPTNSAHGPTGSVSFSLSVGPKEQAFSQAAPVPRPDLGRTSTATKSHQGHLWIHLGGKF